MLEIDTKLRANAQVNTSQHYSIYLLHFGKMINNKIKSVSKYFDSIPTMINK